MEIIVTIGPKSIDKNILSKLGFAGATSFRINLSHSNQETLNAYYKSFKDCDIKPSIDTQGAQVRVSSNPKKESYKEGEEMIISHISNKHLIDCDLSINHSEFFHQLEEGDFVKFGFDGLTAKIITVDKLKYIASTKIITQGSIAINKALDISEKTFNLEPLTTFDKFTIKNSYKQGVETIYVSFCNDAEAIAEVKSLIKNNYPSSARIPNIIAKIETKKAVVNLKEIAENCNGILIDRGDLSREVSISRIPAIVNHILETCLELKKPCFVATNILDQMILERLPSRAEISDIYNLLDKEVSGIVLAAEVAIGNHPIECVQVIRHMSIVHAIEKKKAQGIDVTNTEFPRLQNHLKAWL